MGSELKEIIHQSILNYLHINGFPKTLKRFQSEAQFQNDTWKDSKVNLEDVYSNYINASRENEDKVVVETETKSKKKKKNKVETEETKSDAPKKVADDDTVGVNGVEVKESKKKTKDKKKKNNQQDKKEECVKVNDDVDPDVVKEEKKSSKKRKRLLSDENGNEADKKETNETVVEEAAKDDEVDRSDEHGNEKPEINGGEKSGSQKSGKKQRIGSAEPKTVNAFQRVKIDQVEFAHEKLQDNSYWAKDGADVGYGAKAQEVLGQVRGRDFRHEKTKKKRGSYRGGQIDLQSHSIKFDYSDEE